MTYTCTATPTILNFRLGDALDTLDAAYEREHVHGKRRAAQYHAAKVRRHNTRPAEIGLRVRAVARTYVAVRGDGEAV